MAGASPFITYLILAFIGFANALPLPLTGSTLSLRLTEAGFGKEAIGLFALLGVPFSFKLLWSPLLDLVPPPLLRDCPRKGWILTALLGMILSLLAMGFFPPQEYLGIFALAVFCLSLFTGCLYMSGLSYELESVPDASYGKSSAWVVAGYRIGLLFAGATALYLALLFDWNGMFFAMAGALAVGSSLILFSPEPYRSKEVLQEKRGGKPVALLKEILWEPCQNFFQRKDWLLILSLILTIKLGDQFSKAMEGPFYLSLGFNKADLALASKLWGFGATLFGALLAGFYLRHRQPMQAALFTGMIHALAIGLNTLFAFTGKSYLLLYTTAALENLTGGLAMTAFIFLLWKISDKRFAKVQYALLWSLFSLKGNFLACIGAHVAAQTTWTAFFLIASLLGFGSLSAIWLMEQRNAEEKPVLFTES